MGDAATDLYLPEDQARRIFAEAIAPQLLTGVSRDQPVVVFVAGQPGAGKSRAQAALLQDLGHTQAVTIDADDLRPYHPRYEELALADDRTADTLVHPDAQRWVRMAIACAIEHRYDVVMSNTFRNASGAETVLGRFRDVGYRAEVAFVAVHEAQSRIGVLNRYQRPHDSLGYGRYVPPAVQQEAYHGLLETAERIESAGLAAAVYVYQRGGHQLYAQQLDNQSGVAGARDTFAAERSRAWTPQEVRDFLDVARDLAQTVPANLRPELADIVAAARAHIHQAFDLGGLGTVPNSEGSVHLTSS